MHSKYEVSISYGSKAVANVEVFTTDRQKQPAPDNQSTNKQNDKQIGLLF